MAHLPAIRASLVLLLILASFNLGFCLRRLLEEQDAREAGGKTAVMTLNSFARGGDGGSPSECDGRYHSNEEMVVALSTGWYDHGSRCMQMIRIHAKNGNSVKAKVVDECDTEHGYDAAHGFQPPCAHDVVDASRAVWKALEISEADFGKYHITWSDA